MSREKCNRIIKEAYEKYHQENKKVMYLTFLLEEEFIRKCKTDSEFSEKWGLKIEERELSLEERYDLIEKDKHKQFVTWQSHGTNRIKEVIDEQGVPTKLITVTYKDERIEIYEN